MKLTSVAPAVQPVTLDQLDATATIPVAAMLVGIDEDVVLDLVALRRVKTSWINGCEYVSTLAVERAAREARR